jgi:SAM-dependent methyltransferase
MMFLDDWHMKVWGELPWSVQNGQPAPLKIYGMRGFDWFTRHPEEAVNFNNAMTDMSQADAPAIAASYDFSKFQHIVDVAGGFGTLLAAILQQTPGLRGTLFEMPYFIEQVRNGPILAPYADRCEFVGGSFFESVPSADAYIMKYIIHDWDDEKSIAILSNCRKAIRPGGKLLVVDLVVSPRNQPGLAKLMDLEMLVAPGGLERTEEEFRELYAASGFRLDRVIRTPSQQCIIEGSPV